MPLSLWLGGNAARWAWWIWGLLAVTAALALPWSWQRLAASQAPAAFETEVDAALPTAAPKPVPFTDKLRAPPDRTQVVRALRSASPSDVEVSELRLVEHPASAEALGRLEVSATLRGPYPSIKLVLKGLLDRYDNATVRQLQMRSMAPAPGIEANATIDIWSAPLPADAERPSR